MAGAEAPRAPAGDGAASGAATGNGAPTPVNSPAPTPPDALPPTPPGGLSDAEAAARHSRGLGNPPAPPTGRTYGQIVRENVFTFINNVIFVLGILLVLVGRPLDALVSLAVIGTNIVVSVFQEIRAKRTLDRIALLTRPTATVVRDGAERSVQPEELVVGDILRVGPGDQVILDGRVVDGAFEVDESQLTGESDLVPKRTGDPVYSGSFLVSGGGRFEVTAVGTASLANRITAGARSFRRVLTPLQREVNLVVRVTLAVVVYLEVVLIVNNLLKLVSASQTVGEAALVVGLVPNGLFVSIAIAYAVGAVRILRFGALVQQSNAIESLSNVDVLCLDKTGTLTANRLVVEEVVPLAGSEDRLRETLGAVVASAGVRNKTAEAIAVACPGSARELAADVPFSSARKWSAVAFADGSEPGAPGAADGPTAKNGSTAGHGAVEESALAGVVALGAAEFLRPALADGAGQDDESWADLRGRIDPYAEQGLRVLLAAAHPDPAALQGEGDEARLPAGMTPLGLVILADELRPDASQTLARFAAAGVRPKVISGDDPSTVAALARQAGLSPDLRFVAGPDLDGLDDATFAATATDATVFGRITPAQKERLVDALRSSGSYVAMIGDGVNDVLSLKKADLGIAMQSGTQAARSVADIVLTTDSFASLAPAVEEGQRIVNGMQDILRLFLTRISTVGLLIVTSLVLGLFPIDLRNGSVLTLFTVGIPTALLAVWAQPGQRRDTAGRSLARFIVPAAVLSSLVGLVVLYGTVVARLGVTSVGQFADVDPEVLAAAVRVGQTALTSFLVLAGLVLVVFVEPPVERLAVIEPRSPDWRPTILAIVLAVAFIVLMAVPAGRAIFALEPLGLAEIAVVALCLAGWTLVLHLTWRFRILERFLEA
ncbi:MAG: ATPase, P-type (transporting), superfamily, subfamily [Chloroflexi bacterium]|nr:ATPase, P-type (transporting), superfamily, subfamily [Chloroflexota bacterium]